MLTSNEMTGSSHVTYKLKTYFNFLWIEKDKIRVMTNEAIINTLMSPLSLFHIDASWGYYRGKGSFRKVNILMSVQVQPGH